MENEMIFKKLSDDFEGLIFKNYNLTELMILKKNGKKNKFTNESTGLHALLEQKLLEYGLQLFGMYERGGYQLRAVRMLDNFPIENEEIIKQIYGFTNFKAHVMLQGFSEFSTAFDYDVESGECELQMHKWGNLVNSKKFKTLAEMLLAIEKHGHEEVFNQ